MNSDNTEINSYSAFADVYDELMSDIPYDEWVERIDRDIRRYGISRVRDEASPGAGSEEEALLESERNLVADLA